jgi:hypothetical protein
MSCIYIIKNTITSKVYIGKAKCFNTRQKEHLRKLKYKKHINKHLQNSYNKYGKDVFNFNILEECKDSLLNDKEKYWISFYDSTNDLKGYNLTYGGDGGVGTKETKEKQSKAHDKNKKKVYGFTLDGNLYKVWNSIKECSKELLANPCDVRRTIYQKQYSCKKLILQNNDVFDNRTTPSQKAILRLRNLNGTFKKNKNIQLAKI